MAMQHAQLVRVLSWKFPSVQGINTSNGWLTEWPSSLGPFPSDAQLATWVVEYEALPADDPAKDPRAALRKQLAAALTIQDLRAILEKLIR